MLLTKRDGCARIGKLKIGEREFETPLLIDFNKKAEFEDILKLDFGFAPYVLKEIDVEKFEVLGSKENSISILTGLKSLNPKKIVEVFSSLKKLKPVYVPALATPINLPILIYLGVDIVDNILPIVDAYNGVYYSNDSKFDFERLKHLPCCCPVCVKGINTLKSADYKERSNLIALHNTYVMQAQIEQIKEMIRNDDLRNFVEARVKMEPDLTVILRLLDNINYCHEFNSKFKRSMVKFNTIESFNRPEVKIFFERALEVYKPKTKTVLILPCTAKKPYLLSKTHSTIKSKCKIKVNEIIVSSPLVVPREFELLYPPINYDTPVTGYWSDEEISFVSKKLREFVDKGQFEHIIAHVEGGYKKVVEKALKGYDILFTCEDGVTSKKSLNNLKKALEDKNEDIRLYSEIFKHMVKYQFDLEIEIKGMRIKGRYPDLELILDERILRIDKNYGMLDVYRLFAERLIEANRYTVEIDEFIPKGTIFAAGVRNSDEKIRSNDIVVFYNDQVFGVGRAVMSGMEMIESEGGIALLVKRKWER